MPFNLAISNQRISKVKIFSGITIALFHQFVKGRERLSRLEHSSSLWLESFVGAGSITNIK
jgi:hypothetical protein